MNWKVPLFNTDVGDDEIEAATRVIRSGWLTMGEETVAFEKEFAAYVGAKHAFFVSNCTAALHMAHSALGAGPGDEVICPTLTFVATANSIIHSGAEPVFADSKGYEDLNISAGDMRKKLTPRTKGIVVVHYAGFPCDMDEIMALAGEKGLYVVEDCAHSPGASYKGRMTGSIGDIGCFSFFSNKNMTTGEGGMVVTDRDDLAEKLRLLRSHGMTTLTLDRHKGHAFTYDVLLNGFNYRSAEISAAIGRVQLQKLDGKNSRRAKLWDVYLNALNGIDEVAPLTPKVSEHASPSYHIFPVLLKKGTDREALMVFLRERGIQTSIHYRPVHTFAVFSRGGVSADLPVAEAVMERILTLPFYPTMDESQINHVSASLKEYFSGKQ